MWNVIRFIVIIVIAAASAMLAVVIAKSFDVENTAMIGGATGGIVAGLIASFCLKGASCGTSPRSTKSDHESTGD
jgi:ammonia channel protein AmtB